MLSGDQHLVMGIAWIISDEHRHLELCPEVIHIDRTMNTNDEKFPLFTPNEKDHIGNMSRFYMHSFQ